MAVKKLELRLNYNMPKTIEQRVEEFEINHGQYTSHESREDAKRWLRQQLQEVHTQAVEEIKEKINYLPHYYRSIFSRDCSRQETEEEMSTEMIGAKEVQSILKDIITNIT